MEIVAVVVGLLVVVGLAALWARHTARQQARMRTTPNDLRRADDGGDPPYTDITTPAGPNDM